MSLMRVWQCDSEDNLELISEGSALVAFFVTNDTDTYCEPQDGPYEGTLLDYGQLLTIHGH